MSTKINKSLILNEIKKHYSFSSDAQFAKFLNIGPTTLSSWHTRNTFDIDLIYAKCEDIDANWLLTGKGMMIKQSDIPESGVPFYNLPVSAGLSTIDIIGTTKPDGYITNLPGADLAQAILPVTGMSMQPEIQPGALIGVRTVNNWDTLNTERIYMIITHDDRMIKRIEHDPEDSGIIWCTSPNYQRFKIYKADIIEIHRVCFVYNPK